MIYAKLTIRDPYDCTYESKIVAQNVNAYEDYKQVISEYGNIIIDEFVDDDYGTIVVLPDDYKY